MDELFTRIASRIDGLVYPLEPRFERTAYGYEVWADVVRRKPHLWVERRALVARLVEDDDAIIYDGGGEGCIGREPWLRK